MIQHFNNDDVVEVAKVFRGKIINTLFGPALVDLNDDNHVLVSEQDFSKLSDKDAVFLYHPNLMPIDEYPLGAILKIDERDFVKVIFTTHPYEEKWFLINPQYCELNIRYYTYDNLRIMETNRISKELRGKGR